MQGFRERFSGGRRGDRSTVALAAATLALIAALVFPRVYPAARRGPTCSDLAAPLGGNNRSVLSFQSTDPGALDLRLELSSDTVSASQPVAVIVTFVNEDRGPLILHFNPDGPILTANENIDGVTLEITRVGVAQAVADQPQTYTSPATFANPEDLHLLGSRARCSEEYAIAPGDLAAIGIGPGEYRMRAHYRNRSPGDPRPIQPPNATATPIPQYATNQGVWVGEASSNEVRFTIQP